ncbi:hypothetical protein G5I_05919 [Acromyrmex echinatior]|uniref:Uncharacterized protein n=1 Tax=Acromyrmex echinatior TaxID=103372 RepID=F4WJN8_ACREC|nr:hypothetical protein G5I_05919 [Acromyrmex echinatior]
MTVTGWPTTAVAQDLTERRNTITIIGHKSGTGAARSAPVSDSRDRTTTPTHPVCLSLHAPTPLVSPISHEYSRGTKGQNVACAESKGVRLPSATEEVVPQKSPIHSPHLGPTDKLYFRLNEGSITSIQMCKIDFSSSVTSASSFVLHYAFPKKGFDRKSATRHNSLIMQVTGRKMKVRRRIVSGHKQRSEILGGPQRKIYPPRMWRIHPGVSEGSSSWSDPVAQNRTCLYNGNGMDQYDDGLFPLKRIFTALFSPYSRAVGTREPSASLACSPRSVRQTITKEVLKLTESSTIGRQMTLDFSSHKTVPLSAANNSNKKHSPTEHHALLLLFRRTGTSREHRKIVLRAQCLSIRHVYRNFVRHWYPCSSPVYELDATDRLVDHDPPTLSHRVHSKDLAAASAFVRVHEKDSPLSNKEIKLKRPVTKKVSSKHGVGKPMKNRGLLILVPFYKKCTLYTYVGSFVTQKCTELNFGIMQLKDTHKLRPTT